MDCARDVAVRRVEVPVSQAITHACDVAPGVLRLGIEEVFGDRLDGLPNLDETDTDRIEDEPIGKSPRAT